MKWALKASKACARPRPPVPTLLQKLLLILGQLCSADNWEKIVLVAVQASVKSNRHILAEPETAVEGPVVGCPLAR